MNFVGHARAKLSGRGFFRSVTLVAGGTALGQALLVLAAPLLTRLYTPEDFGLLGIFVAIASIAGVFAGLRYQAAVPLVENDPEAVAVLVVALLAVVGVTLIAALLVWGFAHDAARLFGVELIATYLWLLPPVLFLGGIYQALTYWAVRSKSFGTIAQTKLSRAVATLTVQIGGAVLGPISLLLGHLAGQAAGIFALVKPIWRTRDKLLQDVDAHAIRSAAVHHRRFPLFSTADGLLSAAGAHVPMLLFGSLFGIGAAGLYALAQRVLAAPMSLVGSAVSQVFFSEGAAAAREGRLGTSVSTIYRQLTRIAIIPTLLLIMVGPELFALVFGAEWRLAGELARWMAPWLFLQFVSSPLSTVYYVLDKQDHNLAFQTLLFTTRTIALVAGAWLGSFETAVILFALTSAACYLVMLLWINALVGNESVVLLRPALTSLGLGALALSPLAAAIWLGLNVAESIVAAAVTALLVGVVGWRLLVNDARPVDTDGTARRFVP